MCPFKRPPPSIAVTWEPLQCQQKQIVAVHNFQSMKQSWSSANKTCWILLCKTVEESALQLTGPGGIPGLDSKTNSVALRGDLEVGEEKYLAPPLWSSSQFSSGTYGFWTNSCPFILTGRMELEHKALSINKLNRKNRGILRISMSVTIDIPLPQR